LPGWIDQRRCEEPPDELPLGELLPEELLRDELPLLLELRGAGAE